MKSSPHAFKVRIHAALSPKRTALKLLLPIVPCFYASICADARTAKILQQCMERATSIHIPFSCGDSRAATGTEAMP